MWLTDDADKYFVVKEGADVRGWLCCRLVLTTTIDLYLGKNKKSCVHVHVVDWEIKRLIALQASEVCLYDEPISTNPHEEGGDEVLFALLDVLKKAWAS